MQRTCGFGHLYDADIYASCPYCNRGTRAIYFGEGGGENRTAAPSGFQGGDAGKTTAPQGFGIPVDRGNTGATVAPSGSGMNRNTDPGKTEMPESMRRRMEQEKENKTVGFFQKKYGLDPVVGWLVCVEGPEMGKDYRLYSRINTIGRGEENDVVLAQEQTVSKHNNTRLAYDSKHNNFQVIPADGQNLVYLNDAPLYVPQLLKAYDVLEFGETKLIFVPLCTEQFRWPEKKVADHK